jgi:predicted dehydrogenase
VSALRVGIVGCGSVSAQYLRNVERFDGVRFVSCTDVVPQAAERVAREHGLEALGFDELLAGVDVALCLTPPDLHADVALQAIAAGRHVWRRASRRAAGCWTRPPRPGCSWAARRTRSSAPGSRR